MPKYKYVDGVKYRVVPQSVLGYALVREDSDNSLPAGGTEGQVLSKASNTDYDVEWASIPEGAVIIDATVVLPPPHDLPGDYDMVLTTVESLSEIGSMLIDSPVYLKIDLGAMQEGVTAVGYFPLYNYTDYPGLFTGITGGLIGATAEGDDQLQTITGFEYNNVTYFGLKDVDFSGGNDDLPKSFVINATMIDNTPSDPTVVMDDPSLADTYNTLIFNGHVPVVLLLVPSTVTGDTDELDYLYPEKRNPGTEIVEYKQGLIYNYRTSTFTFSLS